jgi:hypothetical protein
MGPLFQGAGSPIWAKYVLDFDLCFRCGESLLKEDLLFVEFGG